MAKRDQAPADAWKWSWSGRTKTPRVAARGVFKKSDESGGGPKVETGVLVSVLREMRSDR